MPTKKSKKKIKQGMEKTANQPDEKTTTPSAKYPRNAVDKALRIPKAILEQNAGKPCPVKESAAFSGVGAAGPYQVEVSSGIKYGFLERPNPGQIAVTERAKRVLQPQDPQDRLEGLRDAVINAPVISDVYGHYRGENLSDAQFFHNALSDTFGVPEDKVLEFQDVFLESLRAADLLAEADGKIRIVDVSKGSDITVTSTATLKKAGKISQSWSWRFVFRNDAICTPTWRLLLEDLYSSNRKGWA